MIPDSRNGIKAAGFLLSFVLSISIIHAQGLGPAIKFSGFEESKKLYHCQPGPWGDLEYYYIYLEAPDSVVELVNAPSQNTVWRFPGMTPEKVKALLKKAGLSQEGQDELLNASLPFSVEDDIRVFPSSNFIRSLSPEARATIYAVLRRWNENPFHHAPAIIENGNVKEWFSGSGLSEETISKIEALTYQIGNSMAFSDVPLLLENLGSAKEEQLILRALTRTRTMVLRLRVSNNSDADAIEKYWTAGYRYKDALPMLQSITRTGGAKKMDITHLLPPVPRKYLYTFPSLASGMEGSYPDSFWTALNFFNYTPVEPPFSLLGKQKYTEANYEKLQQPFQYGDLIYLRHPKNGRVIQACIYIADGITYTKTGKSLLHPWVFVKLEDLISRYQSGIQVEVEGWRSRAIDKKRFITN